MRLDTFDLEKGRTSYISEQTDRWVYIVLLNFFNIVLHVIPQLFLNL
jgi:hypothetical protein